MTSRSWSFDRAIFRRDLRRTAPLWAIYIFAIILLLPVLMLGSVGNYSSETEQARRLAGVIYQSAEIVTTVGAFGYGGLLAWALWFPLFSTKSAYFYAALPVRRESQFLTHYLSGLTVTLVPNVLVCLFTLAASYVIGYPQPVACLIWLAVTTLGFLFFYGLATLCSMASGQIAAMPVLYTILNLVFVVVEAIVRNLLQTFVFGLPTIRGDYLTRKLSPLYYMLFDNEGFGRNSVIQTIDHGDYVETIAVGYQFEAIGYLGILAGVGVLFAALALMMFRKREMERCGDVICVSWLRPVFQYAFTLGCGLVLPELIKSIVGQRTFSYNFTAILLLMLLGALIGHVAARMLLNKTTKVFRKGWGSLLVCCLVLMVGFGSMRLDLFGYSRYIPNREEVEVVTLNRTTNTDMLYPVTDPAIIDGTLALHQQFLDERAQIEADAATDYLETLTIGYQLTDGSTVYRKFELPIYDFSTPPPAGSLLYNLNQLYNSPVCILARELPQNTIISQENMISCTIYHEVFYEEKAIDVDTKEQLLVAESIPVITKTLDKDEAWDLFQNAVLPDLEAGDLGYSSYPVGHNNFFDDESYSLEFSYQHLSPVTGEEQSVYSFSIWLVTTAQRTIEALNRLGFDIQA